MSRSMQQPPPRSGLQKSFTTDITLPLADDFDAQIIERIQTMQTPRVLETSSAWGGQAIRMAQAGAMVIAQDIDNYADRFFENAQAAGVRKQCRFLKCDLNDLRMASRSFCFDLIVCQRTIHYVDFATAINMLLDFKNALKSNGFIYISALGLHSEMGTGYVHTSMPVHDRHASLTPEINAKYGIYRNVCLYTIEDMEELLDAIGFSSFKVCATPSGNINAIAKK